MAGNGAIIQGSGVIATEDLGVSAKTLDLLASQSTSSTETDTAHGHVNVSMTVYGGSGGPSVEKRGQATLKLIITIINKKIKENPCQE